MMNESNVARKRAVTLGRKKTSALTRFSSRDCSGEMAAKLFRVQELNPRHLRYPDVRKVGLQVPPATLKLGCDGHENASEQRHKGAYGVFPVDVEFGNDRPSTRPRLSRAVG